MTYKKNAGLQRRRHRRIMRSLKICEISAVDVPAQEGAVALIMKRKGDGSNRNPASQTEPQTVDENLSKGAALTTVSDDHVHLIELIGFGGDEINSGSTSWVNEHSHPWIRLPDGTIVIGPASSEDGESHEHELGQLSKTAKQEDTDMPKKTKKTEGEEPTVAELQARLERVSLVAALSDVEKIHLSTLEGDDADKFLAKSIDERKAVIDALAEPEPDPEPKDDDDPVAYKTADGIEIRKSAGEVVIAMARKADENAKESADLRKRLDDSESARANDAFEKRAADELGHLPGDLKARASLLKAAENIEDEDERKAALAALVAGDRAMSKAFDTVGHGGTPEPGSPNDELDQLAKKHQADNPDLTFEQAYDVVLKTADGRALYAKSMN